MIKSGFGHLKRTKIVNYWISKRRNLFKNDFQKGEIYWKFNFKKAKFVKNWISIRRNLLKSDFCHLKRSFSQKNKWEFKINTFSGVQLQSSRKGQTSLKVAMRCLSALRLSSFSCGPNILSNTFWIFQLTLRRFCFEIFRKLSQGFQLCYLTRNLSWSEVKMRNVPKSRFYPIVWRFDRIFPTFFSSLLWFFWNTTIWRDFQNLGYTLTVWQNFATVF